MLLEHSPEVECLSFNFSFSQLQISLDLIVATFSPFVRLVNASMYGKSGAERIS